MKRTKVQILNDYVEGLNGMIDASSQMVHQRQNPKWMAMRDMLNMIKDGAAVGVTVKPKLNWLRLDLAGTYNGIAPGVRAGATWDVFNFGITPSLTLEGGHTWEGKIPGVDKSPDIGLNYLNFHLGAEFGNRNRWRFFIHGGPSYVSVRTDNFQNTVTVGDGITINNPEFHAWILPTFKFGFALYF